MNNYSLLLNALQSLLQWPEFCLTGLSLFFLVLPGTYPPKVNLLSDTYITKKLTCIDTQRAEERSYEGVGSTEIGNIVVWRKNYFQLPCNGYLPKGMYSTI